MYEFLYELLNIANRVFSLITAPINPTCWLYLFLSAPLAIAVLSRAANSAGGQRDIRQTLRALVARAIWLHPSAILDYWCYAINAILSPVLTALGLFAGALASILLYALLPRVSGVETLNLAATPFALALYTMLDLLWFDLSRYVGHYLQHRIPLLWEFHKIHHSARVLTPVTLFRVHPCDFIVVDFVTGLFVGAAGAMGLFAFGAEIKPLSLLGLNLGLFLFYALGANLRHSHVWLAYPGWLSRILLSPAQHQIHHSRSPSHYNANFGSMFALWDWMLGTLYVPKGRQTIFFGLSDGEERDYQSLTALYLAPFQKAWARLRRKAPAARHWTKGVSSLSVDGK